VEDGERQLDIVHIIKKMKII